MYIITLTSPDPNPTPGVPPAGRCKKSIGVTYKIFPEKNLAYILSCDIIIQ